jgi:glycosyltransferase involved in cell wall biosynthesis
VEPLVSVLIPTYNYGHYVTHAIDAALHQTYPNVEVVVTDNCSTDGTVAMLHERYASEPRLRVFQNERNIGLVPNFNRALFHARGEFVLWCSADDWILPPHITRLYEVLHREPDVDVCYSGAYFANHEGRPYTIRALPGQFPADYVDARDELVELLTTVCQVCLPTALFRRAVFDELGGMDESFRVASDWELAVRLAVAGKRFAYLTEASMVVRLHEGQASGNEYAASGENLAEFTQILEKFIDHPAMARIHGRELTVAQLLDELVHGARGASRAQGRDRPSFFTPEFEERVVRLKYRLLARYETYEPARVREHCVSIVMPAIGPPPILMRAVDSVAAQSFGNWQLVVLDMLPFPIESLLAGHPAGDRIDTVRFGRPQRAGASRNDGLRLVRGEYLTFLDEDNTFAPDHLESLVATIERTGVEAVAASCRLLLENPKDGRYLESQPLGEAQIYREVTDPAEIGYVANALPLNALLHHRRLLDRGAGFNTAMPLLEDFDYVIRVDRMTRIAYTRKATVDIHVRIGLVGQALGQQLLHYLPCLDALYLAYQFGDEVAALRSRHREAVDHVVRNAVELAKDPIGLADMMAALAGRAVIPARTAQRV